MIFPWSHALTLLLAVSSLAVVQSPMDIEVVWTFETNSPLSGCPAIVETNEGPLVIIGTDDGDVLALDGAGTERWRDHAGGVVHGWPVLADLPSGRTVLIGDHLGRLHAYATDGTLRWRTSLGDLVRFDVYNSGITPWTGAAVLHGGDRAALVVTDRAGQVSALSADGQLLWQAHLTEAAEFQCLGKPAVGDLDGDGMDEIVVSAFDGRAHCLSADGSWRWSTNVVLGEGGYHSPVIVDWGEGPRVLIVGEETAFLRCLDASGHVLWRHRGKGQSGVHMAIAPLLDDGAYRFFVASLKTGQQILSTDGKELWDGDYSGGRQPFGPSVADVDGDGRLELLMTRRQCPTLRVLDDHGQTEATFDMEGWMNGAPVVGDLDGDQVPEFVIVNALTGSIRALRVRDAKPGGDVLWPTSRGAFDGRGSMMQRRAPSGGRAVPSLSSAQAGLTVTRVAPKSLRTGRQPLTYELNDKRYADAVIQSEVIGPDGLRHIFVRRLDEPTHGWLEAIDRGTYNISAAAYTPDGKCLARARESLSFIPFAQERKDGESLITDLEKVLQEVTEADREAGGNLRHRVWGMKDRWDGLLARTGDPEQDAQDLLDQVMEHQVIMGRLLLCQQRAHERRAATGGPVEMLLWNPGHPWVTWSPLTDVPPKALLGDIRVVTERRAHEATVISIANVTGRPMTVRVWLDPWRNGDSPPGDDAVTLRQQTLVPTARGNMMPDALPALGEAGLVTIPAGETARLWLDWAAGETPAGAYQSNLHVRALTVSGQVWDVPLIWEVLPIALPEQSPLWLHVWAYNRLVLPDIDIVYRDLIEHHVNVFDLPTPHVLYDAKGDIVELDWSRTDRVLKRTPRGSFYLWRGRENIVRPAQGASPVGSKSWERAFRSFVTQWVDHLALRGVDYGHHADYVVDEPGHEGGRRVELLVRIARLYKEADPRIQIFANPGHRAMSEHTELVKRILEVADIVDPHWADSDALYYNMPLILERASRVWTYLCGDEAKERTTMHYYWSPVWKGAELGVTGIGFWSYAGREIDLWQGPVPRRADYELVYQGQRAIIPSHRWQGVRIGVEDYARLWMVNQAADRAAQRGETERAAYLKERRAEIIRTVLDSDLDAAVVAKARADLQQLLLDVRAYLDPNIPSSGYVLCRANTGDACACQASVGTAYTGSGASRVDVYPPSHFLSHGIAFSPFQR